MLLMGFPGTARVRQPRAHMEHEAGTLHSDKCDGVEEGWGSQGHMLHP